MLKLSEAKGAGLTPPCRVLTWAAAGRSRKMSKV